MVNIYCAVSGCNEESYPGCGLSFHRLPANVEIKNKWIEVIPAELTNSSVICSFHFTPEDYVTEARKKFKPGVVPSYFPKKTKELVNSRAIEEKKLEIGNTC